MQNHLKRIALTALLGCTLSAFAAPVSVSTYTNIGFIADDYTHITATTAGAFENLYTFTLAPNSGTLLNTVAYITGSKASLVSTLQLYDAAYSTVSSLVGHTAIYSAIGTTAGKMNASTLDHSPLLANHVYTLVVTGSGTGTYFTNISLAPIPEPETYAMLLAGVGMIGFVTTRRRKKNN